MLFSNTKKELPTVPTVSTPEGNVVEVARMYKHLGVVLDDSLTFKPHIDNLVKKLTLKLFFFWSKFCFSFEVKNRRVTATFLSILAYRDSADVSVTLTLLIVFLWGSLLTVELRPIIVNCTPGWDVLLCPPGGRDTAALLFTRPCFGYSPPTSVTYHHREVLIRTVCVPTISCCCLFHFFGQNWEKGLSSTLLLLHGTCCKKTGK